jgi:phosphohistidine swiveling domain-containing protein
MELRRLDVAAKLIECVLPLSDPGATLESVGGKGAALAEMIRAGLPVPDGFHVITAAYRAFVEENVLEPAILAALEAADLDKPASLETASRTIAGLFSRGQIPPEIAGAIAQAYEGLEGRAQFIAVAVRSSATVEDLPEASFAGQQETYLNIERVDAVLDAVKRCWASLWTARAIGYRARVGADRDLPLLAVVVQRLIPAEAAGILFTANPVNGRWNEAVINAAWGLGEAVVGGEVTPDTYTVDKETGEILEREIAEKSVMTVRVEGGTETKPVPEDLRRAPVLDDAQTAELVRLGVQIEELYGDPRDIEWALADGEFAILQARPITTLREYDPITYDWNSSYIGDYLWVAQEVHPELMTPSTWSLWQKVMGMMKIAGLSSFGNIGGHLYVNYSVLYSTSLKFKKRVDELDVFVGHPPANLDIPIIPVSTLRLILDMIPVAVKVTPKVIRLKKAWKRVLDEAPRRSQNLDRKIQQAQSRDAMLTLWHAEVFPLFEELLLLQDAINDEYMMPYAALRDGLVELAGEDEARVILSTLSSGSGQLASIGPLVGLYQILHGEMSREQYTEKYGHRHANENELSVPRPHETSDWLDRRLAEFEQDPVDVPEMLRRRAAESDALWEKLEARYPERAASLRQKADQVLEVMHRREAARSELTRSVGVVRGFFLRAGQLTGLGEDVFFLTHQELLEMLSDGGTAAAYIPARRATCEKYEALPDYPAWIRGRFDPVQWAADPHRRSDYFDAHAPAPAMEGASGTIQGVAGSAGRVEGTVRLLSGPEEGGQLRKGEILLAATTNVGWTPLFSRAAGVITDIGAPLSHAAIVARELGIPAVVGCGDATMRLKTGDRVRVDGGHGMVEILSSRDSMEE